MAAANKVITVDLGTSTIKFAEFGISRGGALTLLHFGVAELGLDPNKEEERAKFITPTLAKIFKQHRIKGGDVYLSISGQSLWVLGTAVVLIAALYLYFDRSISGKALRATSVNRVGARLVGIGTTQAGRLAFTLAAGLGALCGILVAPLTTIYYDSGFLIGLKGFVGAIIGGLVSYPLAAAGSVLVGLLESYSSFWASAYKEVIVFTLIIPVLLWRSLASPHAEEDEE